MAESSTRLGSGVESRGANGLVLRSALVAALGGLLFGFDTAVISGTTGALQRVFDLGGFGLGFTAATALIGTIVGALFAGYPSNRFGRKKTLFAIGILYFASAIGSGIATEDTGGWIFFMVARFVGGIGVGAASVVAPIYTTEIAPARLRGRLVGLVQFNVVLGVLTAYLSNWVLASLVADSVAWRWMFLVEAAPALLFFLLVFTVPESPRWLYGKGFTDHAYHVLSRLTKSPQELRDEFAEIEEAAALDRSWRKTSLFSARYRKIVLLAVGIAAFNQLSGINAVTYYAPSIFEMAGASGDTALLQAVAMGVVNLIATMAALSVIDRFGRRKLMIIGSVGYLISLGVVASIFLTSGPDAGFTSTSSVLVLLGLLVFIAAHAFGQGSVIWVFIAEIFPNKVRAQGQALGSFVHWTFAAITTWTFPGIAAGLGGGIAFLIFFLCMVGQLIWVLTKMPETKQVPLEEMSDTLGLPKSEFTESK
ncbi:sugar and carbohydrate transporter [Pseudonocardia sp. Ae717_Ps2]|uniref:sugar porter family MFS transporter n=1 Tax=Pseudonocardia sp. Ae717_Ps2 TaxID=1885573 RepID=UPI00094B4481|nr:sugar porter family MFS transporter [Pseudonocardia sp. Ae717_Ps2]OLM28554.1 sugar and carbohydrate transporter [Pseudonocardia sp. Ae717_Ps2]